MPTWTRTGRNTPPYTPRPKPAPAPKRVPTQDERIADILARHEANLGDVLDGTLPRGAEDVIRRALVRRNERAPYKAAALKRRRSLIENTRRNLKTDCDVARVCKSPSAVDHVEMVLKGKVCAKMSRYVREQLRMSPRARRITVHINSEGGDSRAGYEIYGALLGHTARVTAMVRGSCASAAFTIFLAADHRIVDRSARLLIHRAHYYDTPREQWTPEQEGTCDAITDILRETWLARTRAGEAAFQRLFALGEAGKYFDGERALRLGIIDECRSLFSLDAPKPKPAPVRRFDNFVEPYDTATGEEFERLIAWSSARHAELAAEAAGREITIPKGGIIGLPGVVPAWVCEALTEAGLPCHWDGVS